MRLVTLNIWGGRVFKPLMNFFITHREDTDIFCLQEVFNNPSDANSKIQPEAKQDIYRDIEMVLPDFKGYMAPTQDNEESLTVFVNNNLEILEIGDKFVYRFRNAMENRDASTYGINVQYIKFKAAKVEYLICNLHGHWTPNFKGDNAARLEQSRNIKAFLDSFRGKKILCGDFNLAPNTTSMEILESSMKNMIKEYKVTSTRSPLYRKDIKFADYVLVSPDVEVNRFEVLPVTVSDHLPLLLDFC